MKYLLLALFLTSCSGCEFETPDHGAACVWIRGPDVETEFGQDAMYDCVEVGIVSDIITLSLVPADPCYDQTFRSLVVPRGQPVLLYYQLGFDGERRATRRPVRCPDGG